MPSPDVRQYVDLTLNDRFAQELVDDALTRATALFPGWEPLEGNIETTLIELFAGIIQNLVFAVNRLPGAVTEVLLRLYGLTRSAGTPATATATFTLGDALGHTIDAGTSVALGDVTFTTDVGLVIAAGASAGTVAITATAPGSGPNGTVATTPLELLDALAYVDTVVLATDVGAGTDPEDSVAFLNRGATELGRLVTTLVRPGHFTAAALNDPRVYRATTLDNYDPGTGPSVGSNPGHVSVAVAALGGAALSGPDKADIAATLDAEALGVLAVHVIDPTITAVAVTTHVIRAPGFDNATVIANVTAALNGYLNPDTWPWAATVYHNELISLIDQVAGVARVDTLTAPAADAALAGVAPLADAGVLTITTS